MGLGELRDARIALVVLAASLTMHASIAFLLFRIPNHASSSAAAYELEIQVTSQDEGSANAEGEEGQRARRHLHQKVELGGPRSAQNVDDHDRGEGGNAVGATQTVRLASHADPITLQDAPMNASQLSQAQRIRTADDRATIEMRRATPHPLDTPFLASGHGEHRERRRVSNVDPREGAPNAREAALAGAASLRERHVAVSSTDDVGGMILFDAVPAPTQAPRAQRVPSPVDGDSARGALTRLGDEDSSSGRGIQHGRTMRESDAARVAMGRPPVDEANAATETTWRSDQVRDDHDAELLAARMLQSMVDSSERSGTVAGQGRGGVGGGGTAGVGGGVEEGGRANAHMPGRGNSGALDTSQSRYRQWMLDLRARVTNALDFPRARQVAMDEGQSVFYLFVRRDGTLAQAPRLVRSSGFDDLDAAARLAIERSAPFSPVPTDVAAGTDILRIPIPVNFSNPMVR